MIPENARHGKLGDRSLKCARSRHLWNCRPVWQPFSFWSKHLTGLRWIGSLVRFCRRPEGPDSATNAKNLSGVIIF
jgi:hypothetical protein